MLAAIIYFFRVLLLLFGGHEAVAIENLALRQQLTPPCCLIFQRFVFPVVSG
jgi:hypothetical protein